jgi:hypothetical protein
MSESRKSRLTKSTEPEPGLTLPMEDGPMGEAWGWLMMPMPPMDGEGRENMLRLNDPPTVGEVRPLRLREWPPLPWWTEVLPMMDFMREVEADPLSSTSESHSLHAESKARGVGVKSTTAC